MTGVRKDPRDMDAAELTAELNEARHEHSAATNRVEVVK